MISRTTPKAIGLWEPPPLVRWHVIDVATYNAGTNDAMCKGCGERIEQGWWLTGVCPGPKTSERSA
jgi:hypothetical protein